METSRAKQKYQQYIYCQKSATGESTVVWTGTAEYQIGMPNNVFGISELRIDKDWPLTSHNRKHRKATDKYVGESIALGF